MAERERERRERGTGMVRERCGFGAGSVRDRCGSGGGAVRERCGRRAHEGGVRAVQEGVSQVLQVLLQLG